MKLSKAFINSGCNEEYEGKNTFHTTIVFPFNGKSGKVLQIEINFYNFAVVNKLYFPIISFPPFFFSSKLINAKIYD